MRKITTFIVLLFFFCSCSKEENVASPGFENKLWQWEYSRGGWGSYLEPANNKKITLQFKSNYTYQVKVNNSISYEGTYERIGTNNVEVLKLNNFKLSGGLFLESEEQILNIHDNKLSLTNYNVSDGYVHYFVPSN